MKIGLFKARTFTGKIVARMTRGSYSHACIILNDGSIIEARPLHLVRQLKSLNETLKNGSEVDVFDVETTKEEYDIMVEFLSRQIGKKYDYWSVLGFVWFATKESRKTLGKWDCSELVFAAFYKAGIELLQRIAAWIVSPTTLSYSEKLKYCYTVVK